MREQILNTPYLDGDKMKFGRMCLTWDRLNSQICSLTKDELIRLMKYVLETRPNNRTYLDRIVARFNHLNKLHTEEILP